MTSIREDKDVRSTIHTSFTSLPAKTISNSLKGNLKEKVGEVYSVYNNAVNILLEEGSIVTIIDHKLGAGPFSITVKLPPSFTFRILELQQHERVSFVSNALEISHNFKVVELETAESFDPLPHVRPSDIDRNNVLRGVSYLKDLVLKSGRNGGFVRLASLNFPDLDNCHTEELNKYEMYAVPYLAGLITATRARNLESLVRYALRFVGLGPGSTPSGDDFLSGFMIGGLTVSFGREKSRLFWRNVCSLICRSAVGRTNLLSYEYIRYASYGMGAEPVIRTIEAVIRGEKDEVNAVGKKLLRLGSTSGTDIAVGIMFGVSLGL